GDVLAAVGAAQPGALPERPAVVGVLVLDDHRAAGVGDVVAEDLVAEGATGDEEVPVGELGVAGAEQVLGGGDGGEGVVGRIPQDGLEGAGVEPLLVVAGAGDQQDLAGVQQGGVDGAGSVLLGDVED